MSEFRKKLDAICEALPGAEKSDPWGGGHDAWKIGDKMFACIGAVQPGVSVKTPDIETATMLIESGVAERAPYFHKSWVRLPETAAEDEMRHRVVAAYDLIRAKLPKKTQALWPAREDA